MPGKTEKIYAADPAKLWQAGPALRAAYRADPDHFTAEWHAETGGAPPGYVGSRGSAAVPDRPAAADLRAGRRAHRRRIEAEELAGGQRLAPERDIATEYGVTYSTIRKSMELLREQGLIVTCTGAAPSSSPKTSGPTGHNSYRRDQRCTGVRPASRGRPGGKGPRPA